MTEEEKQSFGKTIIDDIRRGDFFKTITRDWDDLKELLLSDGQRQRLQAMSKPKKVLFLVLWLLKGLFFKLPPARRLLLIVSVAFLWFAIRAHSNPEHYDKAPDLVIAAFVVLIFILMLELKDKVLAKDELHEGRAIQMSLLPNSCPVMAGWDLFLFTKPANDVGGDLVDCMDFKDCKIAVSMADISGKGLGSAILMAKLQATLRALAPEVDSLEALAVKVNKILCRDTPSKSFASLLYLELGTTNEIRYINAGHMPPIIKHGNDIYELTSKSPALGLMPTVIFNEESAVIEPGDMIILYSDGVTESKNEFGAFFEKENLLKIIKKIKPEIAAKEAGAAVISALECFQADARQHDDLSLIIIIRK